MTTTQQVIDRVRREFLGSRSEVVNKLAADPLLTDTLSFTYDLGGIASGARLSIELEDIYVWSSDPTTKTAIVQRGAESTTAVSHITGTVVRVSPRISDHEILVAANNELRGLYGEGIFQMATTALTYTPSHSTYQLPAEALDVYRVHVRDTSQSDGWFRVYGWLNDREQDLTMYPSGKTLTFTRETPSPGFDFRVTYRKELGTLSTLSDNVEITTGTPAIDLLVLGTGMRLTRGRETSRNLSDAQASTRRASEVPPGAELGANRALQAAYQQELFREKARLVRLYPPEMNRA